jgi:hypothetical protein
MIYEIRPNFTGGPALICRRPGEDDKRLVFCGTGTLLIACSMSWCR